ncbi:MAG: fasciclin domain-containing protein [Tannerella sp.]|jgi:uncharacterized surface protein with fasciclin (FAS1) repeats|nr:fasciclin domain-containing protein [Tannerella sp.]
MNSINNIASQYFRVFSVPKVLKVFTAFLALLAVSACTDDAYDKHYEADPSLVSGENLWTTIEATPEISRFAAVLKSYGYDQLLSQSQAYTLFAPNNEAMALIDTTLMNDVENELIKNHIARFFLPASGNEAFPIGTLNRKWIELASMNGNYFFGSAAFAVPAKSIVASNGIVHVLSGYEAFFPNTWEYLATRSDLDSIKKYFYSFDEIRFNEAASTPGSVVDGQLTYIDSVFVNYNTLLSNFGYINREDSSYTMIVPNNTAWIEAYSRIKDDFVYYNKKAATADSLQRYYTSLALVQDLIFSNTTQESPQDSLVSTSYNTFYHPQYLFDGTEQVTTSNGSIYIANQLKIKPYESWHQPITVEAERAFGRENTLSSALIYRSLGTDISSGRFLCLEPTTSSGNPTVTFEIPNTLSSYYNIYCVFVPATYINANAVGLKPCKVYFNLNYVGSAGELQTDRFPESDVIETNPNVMDTVLVVSDFKFPTANYGERNEAGEAVTTVTLKVISNVARSETTAFSRDLLLDCILLEPKKQ